ncbi:MAG: hypothetical protein O2913_12965 [Chloroflexi bacterium]|nr:hypothetical protein [Chloroflexota bacterium]
MDYHYRQIPQSTVPTGTLSAARWALSAASRHWGIDRPYLGFIEPTRSAGPSTIKTSTGAIGGFSRLGRSPRGEMVRAVYVVKGMSLRETFLTVAHEVCHLRDMEVGFGIKLTRTKRASAAEEQETLEAHAEAFAQRLTRWTFDKE